MTRLHKILCLLVLLILNWLVFSPVLKGGFIWDDQTFFSDPFPIQSSEYMSRIFFQPFSGALIKRVAEPSSIHAHPYLFYRPLTLASFWLDYHIWGMNPAGFHLTNILLHIANVFFLFFIALQIGKELFTSFSLASLFSIYPLHFENVSWISGRTDLISFFFAALSVLFFLRYQRVQKYMFLGISALFFLLSILAKENTLVLPLCILIYAIWKNPGTGRSEWLRVSIPYFGGLLIWAALRTHALGVSANTSLSSPSIWAVLPLLGFYGFYSLFPFPGTVTVDASRVIHHWAFWLLGISFCLVLAVGIGVRKKISINQSTILLFGSLFLVSLFPLLFLIFSSSVSSPMAWRFLYFPSAFFLGLLAWGIRKAFSRKGIRFFLVLILLGVFGIALFPLNRLFSRNESFFWRNLPRVNRESILAQLNVALTYLSFDDAKGFFLMDQILQRRNDPLFPNIQMAIHENLASYYANKKEYEKAESHFRWVEAQKSQTSIDFRLKYALFKVITGRELEGKSDIQKMLTQFPGYRPVLLYAARIYEELGEDAQALRFLEEDFRLNQDPVALAEIERIRKKTSK